MATNLKINSKSEQTTATYTKDDYRVEITYNVNPTANVIKDINMSIYDNITFGCRIHGMRNKKTLDKVVEKYLRATGLWDEVKDRLHTPASALSIGQQQRLCLARGLAVEPQFILADESTSALDPISSKNIEDLFMKLRERYGIIMVTHTLRQALRIADYVVFMYMGEMIEQGTADELFNHPKHELTKQYLSGVFS